VNWPTALLANRLIGENWVQLVDWPQGGIRQQFDGEQVDGEQVDWKTGFNRWIGQQGGGQQEIGKQQLYSPEHSCAHRHGACLVFRRAELD
jgi:hypothetical protein